jgi:hypothetical protein
MSSKKFKLSSAASVNLTSIQGTGGNVRGVVAVNTNAAARFVKFYDKLDPVVVGTDVPVLTVQVAATSMASIFPSDGISFKNSIVMAMTVNAVDNDTAAVGAGDLIVTVLYE